MKTLLIVSVIVCQSAMWPAGSSRAQEAHATRQTRIDVGAFVYSFSEGADKYGPWWGGRIKATNSPANHIGFTGIFELVSERHEDNGYEQGGIYAATGAYYDWNKFLYTFSSIGFGSNNPYVQFNTHHEINAKLFPKRQVVVGIGGGYVDYHNVNEASYISLGSTYYWQSVFASDPNISLHYQYRRYFTRPVDEGLSTQIAVLAFGWGQGRWTRVRFLYGEELFRAGGGAVPLFDADHRGSSFALEHEQQLNDRYGVVTEVNFVHKSNQADNRTLYSGPGIEIRFFWRM